MYPALEQKTPCKTLPANIFSPTLRFAFFPHVDPNIKKGCGLGRRRLAAILGADVAGYSRLMGA
ncbi:MAG TPA: hypothetical protein VN961_03770, partial [Streptosporangiaceae bacterium]|nr:hypothetical protein [Streptosporangiaceae bacterium]